MWLTGKIVPLESTGLLLSVLLEIGFILEFFHLDFSNLLNFIVVDNQNFAINLMVRKLLLSSGTRVWLFVANKGILVSGLILLWL